MALNALIKATAPATGTPTSGAPHLFAYETTRTATDDPIFRVYRGAVDPTNLAFEVDKDGDITVVGNVDGVDVAAFKAAYDAFVAGINETIDDRVGALLVAGSGIALTYDDAAGTLTVATSNSGTLITSTEYAPGAATTYSTTSTTNVDIDATNLAVTFTVPASGEVRFYWEGLMWMQVAGSLYLGLRNGTTQVSGSLLHGGNSTAQARRPYTKLISGLTPGASVTLKLAWWVSGGAEARLHAEASNAIRIEVWSV